MIGKVQTGDHVDVFAGFNVQALDGRRARRPGGDRPVSS